MHIHVCHNIIMEEYKAISKNLKYYTTTDQRAMFRSDPDLRQAKLRLTGIKLHKSRVYIMHRVAEQLFRHQG